jgi:hypothetical protein
MKPEVKQFNLLDMYKQVLLGNKEMSVGKIFNPKQGVKGNYVLHIPNKESVVEIQKIFGVQDSVKIFDVIKDTYHSMEGNKYKPSVDYLPINDGVSIFVLKDLEHNVFVSVLKDEVVYTVFIGHRDGNKVSFMMRFMDFFTQLPTSKN